VGSVENMTYRDFVVKIVGKKYITSSVYDCTVEDVEYIYNKFSL